MQPPIPGVHRKHTKVVLVILTVLLPFWIAPAPIPARANDELTAQVLESIMILDSYVITRSGSFYNLHVLKKEEADFIPLQIVLSDSSTPDRILSLELTPGEHCPFADREIQSSGVASALREGKLIAYGSRSIQHYKYAGTRTQSVSLIIDVQGKLFRVDGLQVSGGCFWAQE